MNDSYKFIKEAMSGKGAMNDSDDWVVDVWNHNKQSNDMYIDPVKYPHLDVYKHIVKHHSKKVNTAQATPQTKSKPIRKKIKKIKKSESVGHGLAERLNDDFSA